MGEDDQQGQSRMIFSAEKEDIDWPVLRLFIEYGADHKKIIAGALATSILSPLVGLVPTYMIQLAIDAVLLNERPLSLFSVFGDTVSRTRLNELYIITGVIVIAAILSAFLSWAGSRLWGKFSQEVQLSVRTGSYEKIQKLGMEFFDNEQTGQIISILNNDISQMDQLLRDFISTNVKTAAQFIGVTGVLLYLQWQLAVVALLVVPTMIFMSKYFVNRISSKFQKVRQQVGVLNSQIENNIDGMKVIKTYTTESKEAERIRRSSTNLYEQTWDVIKARSAFFPSMTFVNWIGFSIILALGGVWIVRGPPLMFTQPLTVGTLVAFLMYNQRLSQPLIQSGRLVDMYYEARASVVRILSLHEYPIAVREIDETPEIPEVQGEITATDISFSYNEQHAPAISDMTFDIKPGDFVGIVGPTGSGKTTLTKLLQRFYDVDNGEIRLDGYDIRKLSIQELRKAVGKVAQEPYIFSGTLKENISYGSEGVTQEEVIKASKQSNVDEFAKKLPKGYETPVGQRGVKLSGGQRQRVAIARAIISDPEVLILDEATSHVDNETEALIQDSLQSITSERTTIAIAHRLSTIRYADTILVIEDGRLVEKGTHEELLAENGIYSDLWRVQIGDFGARADARSDD